MATFMNLHLLQSGKYKDTKPNIYIFYFQIIRHRQAEIIMRVPRAMDSRGVLTYRKWTQMNSYISRLFWPLNSRTDKVEALFK